MNQEVLTECIQKNCVLNYALQLLEKYEVSAASLKHILSLCHKNLINNSFAQSSSLHALHLNAPANTVLQPDTAITHVTKLRIKRDPPPTVAY